MIKYIYTSIFICFCSNTIGQTLSFSDALEKMYSENQKLKGFEKQKQASHYEEKSYKGLYLPEISINGSYIHLSDPLSLDLNNIKTPITTGLSKIPAPFLPLMNQFKPYLQKDWSYQFQEPNIWRLSADLKWVVYAGGKVRIGNKVSQINSKITEIESKKNEYSLISELAERYFQVQLAKKALEVRKKALESAENHYSNAQKLEKNGIIAPIETMQAKKSVTDAEREVLACQKDIELAKVALLGIIGIEENELISPSSPLFEVPPLQNLNYYQTKAKENYPLIVQAQLKKQLAEQNIKSKQSTFLPNIALFGKKYLWKENLPLTEPDNWVVGVGFQWNIFNGFQDKNKIAQAKATKESIDFFITQAEKDIQTFVKKQYTEIEKQKEQFLSLEQSLLFAKELVRVREKAFIEGFSTSVEVADAYLYLASIEIKRYQALFEMDKTLAQLLETCGLSSEYNSYITN